MPPEEGEDKGSFLQRNKMYVIIGGALVVIIIVALLLSGRNPSPSPKLTLASLNQTVAANLLWAQGKFASQAELIANKANKTDIPNVSGITSRLDVEETKSTNQATAITTIQTTLNNLQTQVNSLNVTHNSTDWEAAVASLNSTLQDLIVSLSPNATVQKTGDSQVKVTTHQAGDYSIVLNLYGNNLTEVNSSPSYCEIETYGEGDILIAVLDPATSWVEDNVMTLGLLGTVAYASIGGS